MCIFVILTEVSFWSLKCTNVQKKLDSMLILFLTKYSFQKYIRLALNKKVARIYISDPNKVAKKK